MALFPTSGTVPGMFPGGTGTGGASGTRAGVAGAGGLAGRAAGGQTFSLPADAKQRPPLSGGRAAVSLGGKLQISNDEFLQLRDFIYAQSGIFIAEARKYLVENRLNNRIKTLNLKSFGEYYYYLRFDPSRREELTKLFEVITTNETSFWRNPPQLQIFQDKVLTGELDKLRRSGQKKLRIWSAGCSTGEEPYTLAIILHEVLKSEISTWDIKITANDLSEAVLAAARRGVYSTYALRTTPRDVITRYFITEGGNYRIDPRLKRLISFGPVNLSDKMMLKRVERSNIIFCRNVIIYFDEEMKRQVIESFYDNLLPGGCMLIGHSESLHNISRAFKPEYHAGTIVYRKEG
ncbi:MAG: protein-glutamate O-methyltransferase CheR [Desulfovibrio sp.]|jgi:chemotaxis protein methyltransferase CheR|nr:protein-glutamate O-methyltransferase CheR [Desulfovibrio sp.]